MAGNTKISKIKPGINAKGFQVALKDYNEALIIEELAANSYDADASTVLILLDTKKQDLHIIDDGVGFSKRALLQSGILGGGDKQEIDTSESKRPYLGAYGFGLKATVKIAKKLSIRTVSNEGEFFVEIDWTKLDEALQPGFEGFDLRENKKTSRCGTGTHIVLGLKNPTSEEMLDTYSNALANLPEDNGKFKCYVGLFENIKKEIGFPVQNYREIKKATKILLKRKKLTIGDPSTKYDLRNCIVYEGRDIGDSSVTYKIYFTGIRNGKVLPMKPGLRGIYVRIQGRLLKQSFTDYKFVNPISKWVKFASGLRVEMSIEWLRGEISLARDSIKFSNIKLEEQFKSTLVRVISRFIQPQLKRLEHKLELKATKEHDQRIELAQKRSSGSRDISIKGISGGFCFIPETDGELALVVSNDCIMKRINRGYKLIDYNDKAPFDCMIYDTNKREFIFAELEPTLIEFLQHKNIPANLAVIITWTLGKWRIGAKKKGIKSYFQLVSESGAKSGHYKLLAFKSPSSKKSFADIPVFVLDQILKTRP